MHKNMRHTQKDMVITSTYNNIDTIESIVLDEENDMQGDAEILNIITTHYNKNHCLS